MVVHLSRRSLLRTLGATCLVGVDRGGASGRPDGDRQWAARELRTFARTQGRPAEQAADETFFDRWRSRERANAGAYLERTRAEPGWKSHGNPHAAWDGVAVGDPARYPGVDAFYEEAGSRERVAFRDRSGGRLSGHVWTPRVDAGALPGVVVATDDLPEPGYWWAAQALVRANYQVLTFDRRGQGRSDAGEVDPADSLDAALSFMRSTPARPHSLNDGRTAVSAPVRAYNPRHDRLDRNRVGLVGHGAGATAAARVQADRPERVGAIVAWGGLPALEPRVPALAQVGDYGRSPAPAAVLPSPDAKLGGFDRWRRGGVPAAQIAIRGGTHFEWVDAPTYPATVDGRAVAETATLAWLDRWLKRPGEPGDGDATDRLLSLAGDDRLSHRHRSPVRTTDAAGTIREVEDLRRGE